MLQKYIIFWFILRLLDIINCQMRPFQRYLHTATHINDKLYILGGAYVSNDIVLNEFFYLDVSVPFNTKGLIWKDLTSINIVPAHEGAASVKGGANNNTLFLHVIVSPGTTTSVYTFNPQSNSWSSPTITGVNTISRAFAINYSGKMYLFSGANIVNGNMTNDLNGMLILDTINLIWGTGSLIGAPSPRHNFGAVLLPDNNIIYIGKQINSCNVKIIYYLIYYLLFLKNLLGGYNLDNNIEL